MRFPTIATWFGIWIGISRFDYSSMIQYPKTRKNIEGYYSMNIYEKIFARLEELHMSQIELSRKTGIATSTISDWRKKKINPQADKLVTICKALDMSLVDLLCDEEDKKIEHAMENVEEGGESDIHYEWIDINDLEKCHLKPQKIIDVIKNGEYPVHLINED